MTVACTCGLVLGPGEVVNILSHKASCAKRATAPNPRAWAVAAALAAESGLDWAAWARGETIIPPCLYCGEPAVGTDEDGEQTCGDECSAVLTADDFCAVTPVPAPWDADAYRADAARRGVEPGPMPSLEYDDGRTRWSVKCWNEEQLEVIVECGRARLSWWTDGSTIVTSLWCMNLDDLARAVTLATAAKRAMGT